MLNGRLLGPIWRHCLLVDRLLLMEPVPERAIARESIPPTVRADIACVTTLMRYAKNTVGSLPASRAQLPIITIEL